MGGDTTEPLEGVDHESVDPDSVDPEEIEAALAHDSATVRQRGARVCAALAREDTALVRPFASELGDLLDDDSIAVTRLAGTALLVLAEDHPGDLVESLPEIIGLFDTDLGGIRLLGAQLLSPVVLDRPEACFPYVDTIVEAIEDIAATERGEVPEFEDRQTKREYRKQEEQEGRLDSAAMEILANVVVALAEADPDTMADSMDDIIALLDVENATAVGGAVDALAEIAEADPQVVAPAIDPLVDCLDHPADAVRARAILALGKTGDERVVSELRTVEEEDEEEEVREMAGEVADALESA